MPDYTGQENIYAFHEGIKQQKQETNDMPLKGDAAIAVIMLLINRWQQNRAARRAAQQEGEAR